MSKLIIDGGHRLEGEIDVQGAKNSVLPILAAAILSDGKNIIYNCPNLSDVETTIQVLKNLGCKVKWEKNSVEVDSSTISGYTIPDELMRKMRSSIIFLGAIISKCKKAEVSMSGGCEIGNRPIDLHLKALKKLGVNIVDGISGVDCNVDKIIGNKIVSILNPKNAIPIPATAMSRKTAKVWFGDRNSGHCAEFHTKIISMISNIILAIIKK